MKFKVSDWEIEVLWLQKNDKKCSYFDPAKTFALFGRPAGGLGLTTAESDDNITVLKNTVRSTLPLSSA